MKRRSWILLGICAVLAGGLAIAFYLTQNTSERLTQSEAIQITQQIQHAFEHKNASGVLQYIAPGSEPKMAGVSAEQLNILLIRYFRSADKLTTDLKNYSYAEGAGEATLQFDLSVNNDGHDSRKEDYAGHITLHLRRVEVPHLLGLYQTKEWRISAVETTGQELSLYGDN